MFTSKPWRWNRFLRDLQKCWTCKKFQECCTDSKYSTVWSVSLAHQSTTVISFLIFKSHSKYWLHLQQFFDLKKGFSISFELSENQYSKLMKYANNHSTTSICFYLQKFSKLVSADFIQNILISFKTWWKVECVPNLHRINEYEYFRHGTRTFANHKLSAKPWRKTQGKIISSIQKDFMKCMHNVWI